MRVQYTAREEKLYDADFRCASCGYAAKVKVRGVGVGAASEGLFAGGGAASDAVIEARATMAKDALRSLDLVRCRKCRARGPRLRGWAVRSGLSSLGLAVAAWWVLLHVPGLGLLFYEQPFAAPLAVVVLAAVIYRGYFHHALKAADERVVFPERGW